MISSRAYMLSVVLFLILPGYLSAIEVQERTNALVIGNALTIQSKILNEERPIWVYLPKDYKTSPNKKYPVLYMLDGAFHFHHITGAVDVLAERNRIPEMIVIAIPYIDYDRRDRDLSPSSVDGRPPVAAADKFVAFLKEELIPYTEKNYRTAAYRMLFGHSRAGIFSINTLIEKPNLFNAYFAISPDLSWDSRLLLKKMEAFSIEGPSFNRKLYVSAADGDHEDITTSVAAFVELLNEKDPTGLELNYSYLKNEDHGSIVHRVFYNNIENLFSDWHLSSDKIEKMSFEKMKEYYGDLSTAFGYKMEVPTWAALTLAQGLIAKGENDNVREVAQFILEQDPNEAQAHFTIGYIHLMNGELELAKEKLETAKNLVDESDTYYRLYRDYLKRISKDHE
ncbi:hypothetical protein NBRC116493_12370 [Aurantivibrio infirmus]